MASASSRTKTPLEWRTQLVSLKAISFSVSRLVVPIYVGTDPPGTGTDPEACWLDTGAPLSVMPFHVHHQHSVGNRFQV